MHTPQSPSPTSIPPDVMQVTCWQDGSAEIKFAYDVTCEGVVHTWRAIARHCDKTWWYVGIEGNPDRQLGLDSEEREAWNERSLCAYLDLMVDAHQALDHLRIGDL